MKKYATFVALFALAPMISGPFVVSMHGPASEFEWAHALAGIATIYLTLWLLLKAAVHRQMRLQASLALFAALLEAIPGMPRLHALMSPILFATLAWAVMAVPSLLAHNGPCGLCAYSALKRESKKTRWIFAVPALVLLPVFFGVGYRHQTNGFLPHIGAALLVAGFLVIFCTVLKERNSSQPALRRACNLTIAAVIVQITLGVAAFVIRLLEIENGLLLAVARTLHITGAAPVLAATIELAIRYRGSPTDASSVRPVLAPSSVV